MIRCTLELLPGGSDAKPQHLGTIEIANDVVKTMHTSGRRGTYNFKLWKKRRPGNVQNGTVADFPRLSYHPWNLVRQILNQTAQRNGGVI